MRSDIQIIKHTWSIPGSIFAQKSARECILDAFGNPYDHQNNSINKCLKIIPNLTKKDLPSLTKLYNIGIAIKEDTNRELSSYTARMEMYVKNVTREEHEILVRLFQNRVRGIEKVLDVPNGNKILEIFILKNSDLFASKISVKGDPLRLDVGIEAMIKDFKNNSTDQLRDLSLTEFSDFFLSLKKYYLQVDIYRNLFPMSLKKYFSLHRSDNKTYRNKKSRDQSTVVIPNSANEIISKKYSNQTMKRPIGIGFFDHLNKKADVDEAKKTPCSPYLVDDYITFKIKLNEELQYWFARAGIFSIPNLDHLWWYLNKMLDVYPEILQQSSKRNQVEPLAQRWKEISLDDSTPLNKNLEEPGAISAVIHKLEDSLPSKKIKSQDYLDADEKSIFTENNQVNADDNCALDIERFLNFTEDAQAASNINNSISDDDPCRYNTWGFPGNGW